MTHNPEAVRNRNDWHRWSARCGCGWTAQANDPDDAQKRIAEHLVVVVAQDVVLRELQESCWHADTMEQIDEPCARCQLREALKAAGVAA